MRFGIQLQYRAKTLWGCVEVGLGTKKLITAVLRKSFNFSLRWLEGVSFSFCLVDSFFFPDLGKAYWNPKRKLGLATHFSEIIKQ